MKRKEILKKDYYTKCRDDCPFLKRTDPMTQKKRYDECDRKCPIIEVGFKVKGKIGKEFAYVDTGYQGGYLRVPEHYAKEFGKALCHPTSSMPDDSEEVVQRYFGEVDIEGTKILAYVTCSGTKCFIGRKIIDKFELHFDKGEKLKVYK